MDLQSLIMSARVSEWFASGGERLTLVPVRVGVIVTAGRCYVYRGR